MIEMSIRGKVAVVTGAASGIGRATAQTLARADAAVALVDRNEAGLHETEKVIAEAGGQAWSFPFDLAELAAIPQLVDSIVAKAGHIDILAQCAGIADSTGVLDVTSELWDRVHTINAKAPFFLMQNVARRMVARGQGGKIVNVSSSSAHRATYAPATYGSSKSALNHFSRIAAGELGKHDINVNVVSPGLTRTPMTEGGNLQAMVSGGPLANFFGRLSEPEDVANVILFLCLPQSRQMTGQVIHTSAGLVF